MKKTAAYGTWTSALTGEFVGRGIKLSEAQFAGEHLFWLETRPQQQGRQTLMCSLHNSTPEELLPQPWNVRSKVHGYGGGSYCAGNESVYFVNATDQQIYELHLHTRQIRRITNTPHCRYADLHLDAQRMRLFAVCEDHQHSHTAPLNRLISLSLASPDDPLVVEATCDFVSSPRLSPNRQWLVYLTWQHPHMPWDSTQLWVRPIDHSGAAGPATLIAGGAEESITQPQWSPDGDLYWISDRSGWWNINSCTAAHLIAPVIQSIHTMPADFAPPQWVFGQMHFGFLDANTILAAYFKGGVWQPVLLKRQDSQWQLVTTSLNCCNVSHVVCAQNQAALIGADVQQLPALWLLQNNQWQPLVAQSAEPLTPEDIAAARAVSFPTSKGVAHGFFYAPTNAKFCAPEDQLPPLIVLGHGGPTAATDPALNFKIQFWTQRGFAVLDVNYRGSSGYGREYRNALRGAWGLADVDDLCAAAEYATTQGWVHPQQRIIRGSSAGGYSVLCALTDKTTFNAGVSLYGIGDLEALARDTHKFEAHYLDSLVGPYPAAQALYRERSPLHKAQQIRCPLLVFQGLEDKVVPPEQAERMVEAVRQAGTPVCYIRYPDEGHGFRNAANIQHQLDTELAFYQQIFGLGDAPAIHIDNWPKLN